MIEQGGRFHKCAILGSEEDFPKILREGDSVTKSEGWPCWPEIVDLLDSPKSVQQRRHYVEIADRIVVGRLGGLP